MCHLIARLMHADTLLEEVDEFELSSELLGDELNVSVAAGDAAMIDSAAVGGRMNAILEHNVNVRGTIWLEAHRSGEKQMGADGSIFSRDSFQLYKDLQNTIRSNYTFAPKFQGSLLAET